MHLVFTLLWMVAILIVAYVQIFSKLIQSICRETLINIHRKYYTLIENLILIIKSLTSICKRGVHSFRNVLFDDLGYDTAPDSYATFANGKLKTKVNGEGVDELHGYRGVVARQYLVPTI